MARDPNKLKVFGPADDLVLLVYGELIRVLQGLIASLRSPKSEVWSLKPEAHVLRIPGPHPLA